MPTKKLPDSANLTQLKRQAKDLLRDYRNGRKSAFQRLREFHPMFAQTSDDVMPMKTLALSDAQFSIAREYGYASWPRLKAAIAESHHEELVLSHNDRLPIGPFKQALDFMDAGDAARLSAHLTAHPDLVHETALFEGENYFLKPTLLEFLPENPIRNNNVPKNVMQIAGILLEAGAKHNQNALNHTLMLAASGQVCREAGFQVPLLKFLCDYGADPGAGMQSALAHEEFQAARTLIACGAPMDLVSAATLDERSILKRLLPDARESDLQLALSLAASAGRTEVVQTLLDSGADPNRYNPPGAHSHCTPLHSAVANNRLETVMALVKGGADLTVKDIHNAATALEWAVHLNHRQIASFLSSVA